jgi:hypothetical protein
MDSWTHENTNKMGYVDAYMHWLQEQHGYTGIIKQARVECFCVPCIAADAAAVVWAQCTPGKLHREFPTVTKPAVVHRAVEDD